MYSPALQKGLGYLSRAAEDAFLFKMTPPGSRSFSNFARKLSVCPGPESTGDTRFVDRQTRAAPGGAVDSDHPDKVRFAAMGRFLACPAGATTCNDVSGTSVLLLLFPLVVLLALLIAWPLARLVSRRRGAGAALTLVAAVAFVYFSSSAAVSLLSFLLGVVGLALIMGRRPLKSDVRPA
jgi:hypothetical protein